MLEQIRYVNHLNEPLYFGENHMFVNMNTLHDYEWDVVSQHERIFGITRTVHEKDFPVRIAAVTEEEGIRKRNELFEIPEKDVLAMIPGRLLVNGYYLPCYVTSSSKSYYSPEGKFLSCDITVTTDKPFWIKDVPLAVTSGVFDHQINNPNAFDSNFRLTIHGPATNPSITIRGHVYKVNVTVPQDSDLVIDSLSKSVYLSSNEGSVLTNVFDKRARNFYIFQKIQSGINEVITSANFAYEVMVYDERSEPAWVEAEDVQYWFYSLENTRNLGAKTNVVESTNTYVKPSGITLYLDTDGHLIEERSDSTKVANYFALENGRLVVYHD